MREQLTKQDVEKIQQEIEQVKRTGMNCYRYAFISRSGFDAQADERVELILLEKLYE